jgi:uncharacterized Fe-S cluster-containing radical SAM superfamily protein
MQSASDSKAALKTGSMKINTKEVSNRYRALAIDVLAKRLLITKYEGTLQERDLSRPINCGGFGRVHQFKFDQSDGWDPNPLPIVPARRALGLPQNTEIQAQVFQNAVCNWRCWYCYVPFSLLAANKKYSEWLTPKNLIDLYKEEAIRAPVIDLSGGQPDLIPEWVPWIMEELIEQGLESAVYLWSDDNLSTDFFWKFLSKKQIELVATYPRYGKVCCIKGYDAESFAFNTGADQSMFDQQFAFLRKLLSIRLNLFLYITLTSTSAVDLRGKIRGCLDRLQELNVNLPLRAVPLQVELYSPVYNRLDELKRASLKLQWSALDEWRRELTERFSSEQRSLSIDQVPLW